jgi:DNA-directed RNA polymerase subunit RPC12/RpoP
MALTKKMGRTYAYLVAVFSFIILAYSAWIITTALRTRSEEGGGNFYVNMMIGVLGLILALSSLSRLRGRIALMERELKKVRTVVVCLKCQMKMLRDFTAGDYVNKEVGECQQCGGRMIISSIYQEDEKA